MLNKRFANEKFINIVTSLSEWYFITKEENLNNFFTISFHNLDYRKISFHLRSRFVYVLMLSVCYCVLLFILAILIFME